MRDPSGMYSSLELSIENTYTRKMVQVPFSIKQLFYWTRVFEIDSTHRGTCSNTLLEVCREEVESAGLALSNVLFSSHLVSLSRLSYHSNTAGAALCDILFDLCWSWAQSRANTAPGSTYKWSHTASPFLYWRSPASTAAASLQRNLKERKFHCKKSANWKYTMESGSLTT